MLAARHQQTELLRHLKLAAQAHVQHCLTAKLAGADLIAPDMLLACTNVDRWTAL